MRHAKYEYVRKIIIDTVCQNVKKVMSFLFISLAGLSNAFLRSTNKLKRGICIYRNINKCKYRIYQKMS